MRPKDTHFFKELLTERLNELEEKKRRTVASLRNNVDLSADVIDHASKTANLEFMVRIIDREFVLIEKIKSALKRIENGTFGICELCEEDISIERLKARPVATKCIECKKLEEQQEKSKIKHSLSTSVDNGLTA